MKARIPYAIAAAFESFAVVEDPRVARTKLHPLVNVLVMTLVMTLWGSIAGANGWDELAVFARANSAWFATLFAIRHGTPSAETFRRAFEVFDPRELEGALQRWVATVSESFAGEGEQNSTASPVPNPGE
jgi:hypothetical protein